MTGPGSLHQKEVLLARERGQAWVPKPWALELTWLLAPIRTPADAVTVVRMTLIVRITTMNSDQPRFEVCICENNGQVLHRFPSESLT